MLRTCWIWDSYGTSWRRCLWVWSSEESSGVGRTPIRITRAVHDLFWGVWVAIPEPSPESCLIFSPPIIPRRKDKMWRSLGRWEPRKYSLEGREWKHVHIEGIFIELLSAAVSTSLVHFKKKKKVWKIFPALQGVFLNKWCGQECWCNYSLQLLQTC